MLRPNEKSKEVVFTVFARVALRGNILLLLILEARRMSDGVCVCATRQLTEEAVLAV